MAIPTNPSDPQKIKSEAAELVKRETERVKQDKLRKHKDDKRIELNLKEGLKRSNEREIQNKRTQLRTMQAKIAQIKFAEENDVRREQGLEQKIDQEQTMEHRMQGDEAHKHSLVEQHRRAKEETKARIAKLEADLKILEQEVERKQREIRRLEGDTVIDAETRKAEFEEASTKQRISKEETLMREMRDEIARYKADEEKRKHEYEQMEQQMHQLETQLTQLETNAREYDREIDQLRREIR